VDLCECASLVVNRHPWERARANFFARLVRHTFARHGPLRCLDVGCGDGWLARQLHPHLPPGSTIVGWDVALNDERIAMQSVGLPDAVRFTRHTPQGAFDLILSLDVFEHVEDDVGFMRQLVADHLFAGGALLCSVPACPALFSHHDRNLRHFRRYRPRDCADRLRNSGLDLVRQGGLFHCLLPVRCLQMLRWRQQGRSGEPIDTGAGTWRGSAAVTGMLTAALSAEGYLSWLASAVGLHLPGLSWWALCEKP
jgi:SAM-dependent methyltransferase